MATAPDFMAACINRVRATPACVSAFGDSTATPKFWSVFAKGVELPYARFLELPSENNFESVGVDGRPHYIDRGTLQLDVFASSASVARTDAGLIAAALNDAPLMFADGTLLEFRAIRQYFVPEPEPALGSPYVFHRVIEFLYAIDRNL